MIIMTAKKQLQSTLKIIKRKHVIHRYSTYIYDIRRTILNQEF